MCRQRPVFTPSFGYLCIMSACATLRVPGVHEHTLQSESCKYAIAQVASGSGDAKFLRQNQEWPKKVVFRRACRTHTLALSIGMERGGERARASEGEQVSELAKEGGSERDQARGRDGRSGTAWKLALKPSKRQKFRACGGPFPPAQKSQNPPWLALTVPGA